MNSVFVSSLPELLELFSKRGIGWLPVKDGEGLVELVGMCLVLGLSGQIEQVGLRPRTWEKAPRRWCLAILDFLFVFFIPSNNTLFETMSRGHTAPKKGTNTLMPSHGSIVFLRSHGEDSDDWLQGPAFKEFLSDTSIEYYQPSGHFGLFKLTQVGIQKVTLRRGRPGGMSHVESETVRGGETMRGGEMWEKALYITKEPECGTHLSTRNMSGLSAQHGPHAE